MANGIDPSSGVRFAVGLDVGTSAVKGAVLTSDGDYYSYASAGYPLSSPSPAWAEQDPDDWWVAVGEVLSLILDAHPSMVGANTVIGLTGQMHTTVIRDASGDLLRPAILWSDARSARAVESLRATVDGWESRTGYAPIPAFTSAHLRWIGDNEPETFARIATVAVPKDDIRHRLGAGWATEPSDASAMNLMDTRTDRWAPELLSAVGIRHTALPEIVESSQFTGVVRSLPDGVDGARLLGAHVIAGAGDQAAQAYALGAVGYGEVAISVGTSGAAMQAISAPRPGAFRHCVPATWLALDSTHAAGLALAWWADVAGIPVESSVSPSAPADELPLFLPYLQGGRGHDGVPGTLTDLRASHSSTDIMHAVAEGVGIELVRLVREATGGAVPEAPIGVGGRAGKNATIRSVLAAGLGRPVRYADRGPAQGVALLAARSAGWLADGISEQNHHAEITPVDPALATRIQHRIVRYSDLVDRLS